MSGIICPSYKAGFASPQRGRLRWPSLWRGCIGAWAPCLGQSGSTLRDHSPYGNHGALTNMDPANDWIISGGLPCLYLRGTNQHVRITDQDILSPAVSIGISMWFYMIGGNGLFSKKISNASNDEYNIVANSPTPPSSISFRTNFTTGTPATHTGFLGSVWTHIACTSNGSNTAIYKNGVLAATGSQARAANGTSDLLIGSLTNAGSSYFNGYVDDIMLYAQLTPSQIQLLATRRGVAYETTRCRSYKSAAAPPAGTANNLMLLGVG